MGRITRTTYRSTKILRQYLLRPSRPTSRPRVFSSERNLGGGIREALLRAACRSSMRHAKALKRLVNVYVRPGCISLVEDEQPPPPPIPSYLYPYTRLAPHGILVSTAFDPSHFRTGFKMIPWFLSIECGEVSGEKNEAVCPMVCTVLSQNFSPSSLVVDVTV